MKTMINIVFINLVGIGTIFLLKFKFMYNIKTNITTYL